jgi:hypothetical protein
MGGCAHVRRRIATAIPVALLAILLVVLPSVGSRLVRTAELLSPPAGAAVHQLGDEVAPSGTSSAPELRARGATPDDPPVLVAVLASILAALVVGGAWSTAAAARRVVPIPIRSAPSGRSPPRRLHDS